jgi:hypothetical protein
MISKQIVSTSEVAQHFAGASKGEICSGSVTCGSDKVLGK